MISQIRSASLSVNLNNAEGASRKSEAERKKYYGIARGSLIEIDAALDIAKELGYLINFNIEMLGKAVIDCFKMLTGLINQKQKQSIDHSQLTTMQQHYLALDLVDEPDLIAEYDRWHQKVWPEIIKSIKDAGVTVMDIYRTGNRMFMIIEAIDDFTFGKMAVMNAANSKVLAWEELMWSFQQALPGAKPGQKWVKMDKIFSLPNPE